ncbi:MAG: hypothetical protein ACOC0J_00970 [Myxococcota bacterium]
MPQFKVRRSFYSKGKLHKKSSGSRSMVVNVPVGYKPRESWKPLDGEAEKMMDKFYPPVPGKKDSGWRARQNRQIEKKKDSPAPDGVDGPVEIVDEELPHEVKGVVASHEKKDKLRPKDEKRVADKSPLKD